MNELHMFISLHEISPTHVRTSYCGVHARPHTLSIFIRLRRYRDRPQRHTFSARSARSPNPHAQPPQARPLLRVLLRIQSVHWVKVFTAWRPSRAAAAKATITRHRRPVPVHRPHCELARGLQRGLIGPLRLGNRVVRATPRNACW